MFLSIFFSTLIIVVLCNPRNYSRNEPKDDSPRQFSKNRYSRSNVATYRDDNIVVRSYGRGATATEDSASGKRIVAVVEEDGVKHIVRGVDAEELAFHYGNSNEIEVKGTDGVVHGKFVESKKNNGIEAYEEEDDREKEGPMKVSGSYTVKSKSDAEYTHTAKIDTTDDGHELVTDHDVENLTYKVKNADFQYSNENNNSQLADEQSLKVKQVGGDFGSDTTLQVVSDDQKTNIDIRTTGDITLGEKALEIGADGSISSLRLHSEKNIIIENDLISVADDSNNSKVDAHVNAVRNIEAGSLAYLGGTDTKTNISVKAARSAAIDGHAFEVTSDDGQHDLALVTGGNLIADESILKAEGDNNSVDYSSIVGGYADFANSSIVESDQTNSQVRTLLFLTEKTMRRR
eukprot:GHVL01033328.1.p1 GENE.GHVL01033328.1~~GHVL01033328.1.p1  ORF type:complete len:413 (+),score=83.67 GHVL01033328.1:30-1241(+)